MGIIVGPSKIRINRIVSGEYTYSNVYLNICGALDIIKKDIANSGWFGWRNRRIDITTAIVGLNNAMMFFSLRLFIIVLYKHMVNQPLSYYNRNNESLEKLSIPDGVPGNNGSRQNVREGIEK
jgi:hypothetical protein